MSLISYAQNQEDIMLWRALKHVKNGFYIDVGAAEPDWLSVTKLFYQNHWSGINVEPNPVFFKQLCQQRPRDINLDIGLAAGSGSMVFHVVEDTGLSTFDAGILELHRSGGFSVSEMVVPVMTLAEICHRYRPDGPIHFLKIDVEGFESSVLEGADFISFRPWIVVVEATLPSSQVTNESQWEWRLTSQSYHFVWFDGLNRFYVADEKIAELGKFFTVQPNVFDEFIISAQFAREIENLIREVSGLRLTAEQDRNLYSSNIKQLITAAENITLNLEEQSRRAMIAEEQCARMERLLAAAGLKGNV